ncbi:phosphate propanoyltransferase [Furfurilactobacillus rossiae]|uniref:Phosphate propanoyltransferase n=1 Tax=Furfurilactobacillus rossiae DSM 15814 TaxID=1114972 RepID=A0A0R1RS76_9LACO|nr:phosphate propanoyltransferase [Furfurilactobacillus rossiae]KRL56131.1 propanediol utilization phosphotransacylase [Furfurilactobacillus rossiae DSM 15814]QFR66157.1 phosphate propanoyltransferase [Furfurilactobacillus rossiae]QLE61588.1 Ethanolamine utilization protein similar to PduL [Furfurilactobacillus rossiae]
MTDSELRELVKQIVQEETQPGIPIGVSNHHVHLSEEDFAQLFPGQKMTKFHNLKQPADFATNQKVTVIGPHGQIDNVRVLGPCRKESQVELSLTDGFQIGVDLPVRLSGDLDGAPKVILQTKDARIPVYGAIAAKRHIHMSLEDGKRYGVKYGDEVSVEITTGSRRLVFNDVMARPRKDFVLEMHIDTDEANAAGLTKDTVARILPKK